MIVCDRSSRDSASSTGEELSGEADLDEAWSNCDPFIADSCGLANGELCMELCTGACSGELARELDEEGGR